MGIPLYGIRTESSPDISRNKIYDNSYGILVEALNADVASPIIENNVIYKSGAGVMNYAIFMRSNNSSVVNPVIYHNTIDGGTDTGIAIENDGSSTAGPSVFYNIISNFGQYGIQNKGGSPVIDFNDVWNNLVDNYQGVEVIGTFDISVDPLYENYQLQSASACINAIPEGAGDTVKIDYAGNSRPQWGAWDLGAYEYMGPEDIFLFPAGRHRSCHGLSPFYGTSKHGNRRRPSPAPWNRSSAITMAYHRSGGGSGLTG